MSGLRDQILSRVQVTGAGCWEWFGTVSSHGYGRLSRDNKDCYAHRLSYEVFVGDIPSGHEIDHLCHNRRCVRPEHLRAVTRKGNVENHNGPQASSQTKTRGVYPSNGRFAAQVTHNGRCYWAGRHDMIEEAERAVVALRNLLHSCNDRDRRAVAA